MPSNIARTEPAQPTTAPVCPPEVAVTRSLLGYGMLVGPFYLVVGIVQGLVRDGFSFARHPLSVLANGPGGWVQTTNFVISGAMVVAAALGIARATRSRATSWWLGIFGASMLAAAVFRADPIDGFPVGTPPGPPTSMTTRGLLHFAAGGIGFVSLGIACLVAWRMMSRRGDRATARLSLFSGIGVLLGFFGGPALRTTTGAVAGIWLAVVVGWTWLAILSRRLYVGAIE